MFHCSPDASGTMPCFSVVSLDNFCADSFEALLLSDLGVSAGGSSRSRFRRSLSPSRSKRLSAGKAACNCSGHSEASGKEYKTL
jgi:hypothetical protein